MLLDSDWITALDPFGVKVLVPSPQGRIFLCEGVELCGCAWVVGFELYFSRAYQIHNCLVVNGDVVLQIRKFRISEPGDSPQKSLVLQIDKARAQDAMSVFVKPLAGENFCIISMEPGKSLALQFGRTDVIFRI